MPFGVQTSAHNTLPRYIVVRCTPGDWVGRALREYTILSREYPLQRVSYQVEMVGTSTSTSFLFRISSFVIATLLKMKSVFGIASCINRLLRRELADAYALVADSEPSISIPRDVI